MSESKIDDGSICQKGEDCTWPHCKCPRAETPPPSAAPAPDALHPLHRPMLDGHHTDAEFMDEDRNIGGALAHELGTLFADVDDEHSRYWYHERTSVDEWSRVVRALRIHGLKIVDRDCAAPTVSAAPDAWLHIDHRTAYVITDRVKSVWLQVDPKHVEHYTIPLYAKAAP